MADGRSTQGAFKWSRNLREESLSETNRLKLIEKQKQLLESKRQRQPQVTATSSSVSRLYKGTSIPGTNVSSNERLIDVADEKEQVTGFVNEALVPDAPDTSPPSSAKSCKSTGTPGKKVPHTPKKTQETLSDSDSFDSSPENMSVLGGTSSPDLSPGEFGESTAATGTGATGKQVNASLHPHPHQQSKHFGPSDCLSSSSLSQSFNPLNTIPSNAELLQFANRPVAIDKLYQCTIIRDKRGLDQSFYPTYFMYLQAVISRNGNYTPLNENRKSDTPSSEKSKLDELKPSSPDDVVKSIFTTNSPSASTSSSSSSATGTRLTGVNQNITTGSRQVLLMCGRRRKKGRYYLVSLDPFDISKGNSIGKLKYNLIGTQFTSFRRPGPRQNIQDATIVYDANILGFKGPRKMTVFFADPSLQETSPVPRNKGIIQLKNKTPVWNEDSQSYVLNFHGRVTQASVKNFQLVEATDDSTCSFAESMLQQQPNQTWITSPQQQSQSELSLKEAFKKSEKSANNEYAPTQPVSSPTHSLPLDSEVVMQFGRVSDKEFTCDIRYPLSPFQAFAIALSSFDSKLACE